MDADDDLDLLAGGAALHRVRAVAQVVEVFLYNGSTIKDREDQIRKKKIIYDIYIYSEYTNE